MGLAYMGKLKQEEPTFSTVKGLGYVSMFMGIPLGILLIFLTIGIISGFILYILIGTWGLLSPLSCFIIILFIRILCETDNKALEILKWKTKGYLWRIHYKSMILIISPNKQKSKNDNFFTCLKKIYIPK
jgi:type IV secretion system protein VirB3